jgi:hypothetical protein
VTRPACVAVALAFFGFSCAAPPQASRPPAILLQASAEPHPPLAPRLSDEEKLAAARTLATEWDDVPSWDHRAREAWLAAHAPNEADVREALALVARECVRSQDRESGACAALVGSESPDARTVVSLAEILAELVDPTSRATDSGKVLVQLVAAGAYTVEQPLERLLQRRMSAKLGPCAPPTAEDVAAARATLDDFLVVERGRAKDEVLLRKPSAAELDDLAYFLAAAGTEGPEVGRAVEDASAPPLPKSAPEHETRAKLAKDLQKARLAGDLEQHLALGEQYLLTLGYPGPIRTKEERHARWGSDGASAIMRELATSAEVLGDLEKAEAMSRRARYDGASCGTSAPSFRDDQLRAVIRTSEPRLGCHRAVVERLFGVDYDPGGVFGPSRLSAAGFDVARLYRGALVTAGRGDAAELRAVVAGAPLGATALARLDRVGPEAWAERTRAIPGLADTKGAEAIEPLLDVLRAGRAAPRTAAAIALGLMLEDRGFDPCDDVGGHRGWGYGSSAHPRKVAPLMLDCATRPPEAVAKKAAKALAAIASDPSETVREEVARALGRLGRAQERPALRALAKDRFGSGQICTSQTGRADVCEPNRPVARAATEALEAVAAADAVRAEKKKRRPEKAGAK